MDPRLFKRQILLANLFSPWSTPCGRERMTSHICLIKSRASDTKPYNPRTVGARVELGDPQSQPFLGSACGIIQVTLSIFASNYREPDPISAMLALLGYVASVRILSRTSSLCLSLACSNLILF
jgi:hypothetical protein